MVVFPYGLSGLLVSVNVARLEKKSYKPSKRVIYLAWMVDVFRQQRQLAELAVVNATMELLIQQPEVLVRTTNDPRFAVTRDLQGHQRTFRFHR